MVINIRGTRYEDTGYSNKTEYSNDNCVINKALKHIFSGLRAFLHIMPGQANKIVKTYINLVIT